MHTEILGRSFLGCALYRNIWLTSGHEGPKVEMRYNIILSLTSALDGVGDQRHAPATLSPGRAGTHCIGSWVGPRAGPDGCGKSHPQRD
jgi:hypothetical protein